MNPETPPPGRPYRSILGDAYEDLPRVVRDLHDTPDGSVWTGVARVERGPGLCAGLVAWLFGFPSASVGTPVSVTFQVEDGVETWRRNFGGRRFESTLRQGTGRWSGLLVERLGPVTAAMALVVSGGRLDLVMRGWSLLGVPMPLRLAPGGPTHEGEVEGRYAFHVEIHVPGIGHVVTYDGTLGPAG